MFSFEGNYKRTPSQNLGGASHTNDRETLIRRAQTERQKRAEIRKQHTGAITIQSCVRSFLCRIKCKQDARTVFDQYLTAVGLTNPEQLEYLLRCILFFYDNRNEKDGERLVSLNDIFQQWWWTWFEYLLIFRITFHCTRLDHFGTISYSASGKSATKGYSWFSVAASYQKATLAVHTAIVITKPVTCKCIYSFWIDYKWTFTMK